jgi:hypothetical protein
LHHAATPDSAPLDSDSIWHPDVPIANDPGTVRQTLEFQPAPKSSDSHFGWEVHKGELDHLELRRHPINPEDTGYLWQGSSGNRSKGQPDCSRQTWGRAGQVETMIL